MLRILSGSKGSKVTGQEAISKVRGQNILMKTEGTGLAQIYIEGYEKFF
jgi:hypothetical protein